MEILVTRAQKVSLKKKIKVSLFASMYIYEHSRNQTHRPLLNQTRFVANSFSREEPLI